MFFTSAVGIAGANSGTPGAEHNRFINLIRFDQVDEAVTSWMKQRAPVTPDVCVIASST
jgi:hypothetical protein